MHPTCAPPPSQRARWAGVGGNLVKVSWAASAAVGGVLADRCGYRATFLLTAALQGLGTVRWQTSVYQMIMCVRTRN